MIAILQATAIVEPWFPMETLPKDGTRVDLFCETTDGKNGATVIVREVSWARQPIGNTYGLFGKNNVLSPYLVPLLWRLHQPDVRRGR